eukprot:jgi/Mesvir1/1017/Mv17551-RA.1
MGVKSHHDSEKEPLVVMTGAAPGGKEPAVRLDAAGHKLPERNLTLIKLVAITCSAVAGGPYGFEDCVGAAGPYYTLMVLLFIPFIWSIPMALMTAELSCMIPENGGHILWVSKAFGPFWSFSNGYWSLFCYCFEGGLYPVLFMDYLSHMVGVEFSMPVRMMLGMCMIMAITVINVMGSDLVGTFSLFFTLVGITPFVIMILLGVPQLDIINAVQTPRPPIQWGLFMTIMLWNTSGFDCLGACAGEVKNPSVTFPRALGISMIIIITMDLLVLSVGVSVFTDYPSWSDGSFVRVAEVLGGPFLTATFTFGATISVVGLMMSLQCTSSRILYGMGIVGTLPSMFAKTHPKYGTPYFAMIANAMLMGAVTFLPFSALAEAEMWFYCVSTILKFAALVKLRERMPNDVRPYRIPLTDQQLLGFSVMPILLCFSVCVLSSTRTQWIGLAGVGASTAAFLVSYFTGGPKDVVNFEVLTE